MDQGIDTRGSFQDCRGASFKGGDCSPRWGAEKEKGTEAKSGEFERRKEKEEVGSLVRGGWSVSFALKRRSVKPGGGGVFG